MTDQTDYERTLLAGAKDADGKPVHDLRLPCPGVEGHVCDEGVLEFIGHYEGCPTCGGSGSENGYNMAGMVAGSGSIPNPDSWAMIAAAQAQFWMVIFVTEGKVLIHSHEGKGPDNPAALTNAMVQATEPLAVNWGECPCMDHVDPASSKELSRCRGTGKVLKETP